MYDLQTIDQSELTTMSTLAATLVKSGYFRDAKDASQAFVKILAGRELGLAPFASMTGIHIVEGKPELSGHLLAAQIKRNGKYDYRIREHTNESCTIDFFEITSGKKEKIGDYTFTIDDAQRAGLKGKQNYQRYPRAMLFNRCLSAGYKVHCPDALNTSSVYAEGEIGARDFRELEGEVREVQAEVKQPEPPKPEAPAPKVVEAEIVKPQAAPAQPEAAVPPVQTPPVPVAPARRTVKARGA